MSDITPPNPQVQGNQYLCEKGHVIEYKKHHKYQGFTCIYCSNKRVLAGFNDLQSQNPDLAAQWHPTKNGDLTPEMIMYRAVKKVWWQCEKGHEWEGVLEQRHYTNANCPYCSNKRVLAGFNDLQSQNPDLAVQWHPTKNGNLTPEQVTPGSTKKVWWQCNLEHEWETTVQKRTARHYNCPTCSNQKLLAGFNDLVTLSPHVAVEWHPTKNGDLTPEQVFNGSNRKVWWQCAEKHEWETTVQKRTARHYNCPTCSNQRVHIGFNDLQSQNPDLAAQWHPTKNGILTPDQVTPGSNKKVWWQCNLGHEWVTEPRERQRYGCPKCPTRNSKPEKEIVEYLQALKPTLHVENNVRKVVEKYELDIYIPEQKIAIEYNGLYWHTEDKGRDKNYHYDKWLACKEQDIQLIQVWGDDWDRNPGLIKNMLAHKLGISSSPKFYARKTVVKDIAFTEAHKFLEKYHVQGSVRGSYYLGLFTPTGELVAVMVFKRESNLSSILSLTRYATSGQIVGGFTKLLRYAEKEYVPEMIITFSDNTVSDGGLYENNDFVLAKTIAPDYMYYYKQERVHKFNFRLKRFRNDPELQFVEGLTEKELADLNRIYRVWDAGKVKWVKSYDNKTLGM